MVSYADYGLPFFSEVPRLKSYINANAKPLNLNRIIGDARIIYFGESHVDTSSKSFLTENMTILKQLNVTHLGLEMFRDSRQALLDKYTSGKVSDEVILDILKVEWGHLPSSYLSLIKAALESGIKIVAIDGRTTEASFEIDVRDE